LFKFIPFEDPENMSPAVLAYVGDAVYELYIRSLMARNYEADMDFLHKQTVGCVKAEAQARLLREIEKILSEEELRVVKRGRNSKSGHVPRKTDVLDYRYSTAFECLIGYLYLAGRLERLNEVLSFLEGCIFNKGEDYLEGGTDQSHA